MKLLKVIILFVATLVMMSCDSEKKDMRVEMQAEIDSLKVEIEEAGIKSNSEIAPMKIVKLYEKYANDYPEDTISKSYLFQCAQVNVGLGLAPEAIANLDTLVVRYPNTDIAPSALQFKAFILDEKMRRFQKAEEVINELIVKYPESDIIENAKAYKETLGKSPEQIIKEMEAKINETE